MNKQTNKQPSSSRFAFARVEQQEEQPCAAVDENTASIANTPAVSSRLTGVVARLVGQKISPKYGFIQTTDGQNIFFHWKGLSVDAMACIECGTEVEFDVCPNPYSNNKPMAINLSVKGCTNKFQGTRGILSKWFPEKSFGFLTTSDDSTMYFAHKSAFNETAGSMITDSTQLEEGMEVLFDKSLNYKSSPPKPFALNVKVTAMPTRPTLSVQSGLGRPALAPWAPSSRVMNRRSNGEGELCDTSPSPSPRSSWRSSNNSPRRSSNNSPRSNGFDRSGGSESGRASWRSSARFEPAKSTLFQNYKTPNACKQSTIPPPHGFSQQQRDESWRRTAPAC